jgi:hypothetical protein
MQARFANTPREDYLPSTATGQDRGFRDGNSEEGLGI